MSSSSGGGVSGFCFNFLETTSAVVPERDCHEASTIPEQQEAAAAAGSALTPAATDERTWNEDLVSLERHRFGFGWVNRDELGPLLQERAQEELVYTEVPVLRMCDGGDYDDNSNSENDNRAPQQQPYHQQSPLRCVDLESSSYRIATDKTIANDANKQQEDEEVWKTTDIEPGVYEGGRKLWECSRDLLAYLVQEKIALHNHRVESVRADGTNDNIVDDEDTSTAWRPVVALELGCGHGLPGCYLLREALRSKERCQDFTVVFTDYNRSVVLDATLSNIVLNCTTTTQQPKDDADNDDGDTSPSSPLHTTKVIDDVLQHVWLGAGDWMEMSNQLLCLEQRKEEEKKDGNSSSISSTGSRQSPVLPTDGQFDLILAAETIYSEDTARETALLLQRHLRVDTGVAYVATKRYYFGVGGGVDPFRAFADAVATASTSVGADSNDSTMTATTTTAKGSRLVLETVRVHDNGTSNIREVLKVQRMSR